MITTVETAQLHECRKRIEVKVGHPKNEKLRQRDFVYLSELIFEETQILLSLSTLKRLWADDSLRMPHPTTLNALAMFVGYKNWLDFKSSLSGDAVQKRRSSAALLFKSRILLVKLQSRARLFHLLIVIVLAIAVLAGLRSAGVLSEQARRDYAQVSFSGKKVVPSGLPNTVVFDYHLGSINFDDVFIEPSADSGQRIRLMRKSGQQTSVYYEPGLHHASLIIDGKVVRRQGLHIGTDGWLGLVRRGSKDVMPVYLSHSDIFDNGRLYVSSGALKANRVNMSRPDYSVAFYNVRDFGNLYGDNFTFRSRIRNGVNEGGLVCQYSQITVMSEQGDFKIPLSAPGCVGNIDLAFPGIMVSGQENDLSAFGCDLANWNDVILEVRNSKAQIQLNDQAIYKASLLNPVGKVVGLSFQFAGCGSVDFVTLEDGANQIAYVDHFDRTAGLIGSMDKPYQASE